VTSVTSHYQDEQIVVTKSQRKPEGEGVPASPVDPVKAPAASGGKDTSRKPPLTPREYVESYSPRIDGLAYTAPVYDEVTKPTEAPVPVACIESASKGCRCWSQQATRLDMCPKNSAGTSSGRASSWPSNCGPSRKAGGERKWRVSAQPWKDRP
jgi:hypothetical protein